MKPDKRGRRSGSRAPDKQSLPSLCNSSRQGRLGLVLGPKSSTRRHSYFELPVFRCLHRTSMLKAMQRISEELQTIGVCREFVCFVAEGAWSPGHLAVNHSAGTTVAAPRKRSALRHDS